MGDLEDLTKETLPKMAVTFFTVAATKLLAKDSIKSAVRGRARKIITGSSEKPYHDVETVEGYADKIMDILGNKGISPASIGIDGPPGSGKSTLGRSLAKCTGLKWKTLYVKDMREPYYFMPGRIYENIRLFRTQNIDNFDVIIYIDCQVEDAQRRVVKRDRNAALADYVDFEKLKQIGDAAFEMADGEEISIPMSPIRFKIRPKDGYKDIDNLRTKLHSKGLDVERFSKEELFFVYCYGKPKSGILPYVKLGAYNNEFLSAAYAALRLATAKSLLS
jgi:deoxyadenosine/deoxycytidine kinase